MCKIGLRICYSSSNGFAMTKVIKVWKQSPFSGCWCLGPQTPRRFVVSWTFCFSNCCLQIPFEFASNACSCCLSWGSGCRWQWRGSPLKGSVMQSWGHNVAIYFPRVTSTKSNAILKEKSQLLYDLLLRLRDVRIEHVARFRGGRFDLRNLLVRINAPTPSFQVKI